MGDGPRSHCDPADDDVSLPLKAAASIESRRSATGALFCVCGVKWQPCGDVQKGLCVLGVGGVREDGPFVLALKR